MNRVRVLAGKAITLGGYVDLLLQRPGGVSLRYDICGIP